MDFSTIKIYGGSDINYVWSRKGVLTDEEISGLNSKGIITPIWDGETDVLAAFTTNLAGSNLSKPIDGYIISKQNIIDDVRHKVAEVGSDITHIKDFNIENTSSYQYFITPFYEEDGKRVLGDVIPSNTIKPMFESWSLVGLDLKDEGVYTVDKNNIWSFCINTEGGAFKLNNGRTITEGKGRFPKVYAGIGDYLSGSFTCYIGDINYYVEYVNDDIAKLKKWRKFCNNGQLKLLKDIKGHVIPCEITDCTYDNDDKLRELPTTISFNFTQLEDAENIAVYSTDEF